MSKTNDINDPFEISQYITPAEVLAEIAERMDQESQVCPGVVAGPAPDSLRLAAIALDVLGQYGFIDGSYYRLVTYARTILELDQR